MFARRSAYRLFAALACGMILADRSTVVGMTAAAGMGTVAARVLVLFPRGVARRCAWPGGGPAGRDVPDPAGRAAGRRRGRDVLQALGAGPFQARGPIYGSAQGGKKVAFGNTWVVAAIVVRLSFCSSPVALPVLFRLWRGKGTASQVELAAEMLEKLAGTFPGRKVHGTGDAAFHGVPLVIEGTTWTTRAARQRGAVRAQAAADRQAGPPAGQRRPAGHLRADRAGRELAGCRHPRLRAGCHGADRRRRCTVARQLQERSRPRRPGQGPRLRQGL